MITGRISVYKPEAIYRVKASGQVKLDMSQPGPARNRLIHMWSSWVIITAWRQNPRIGEKILREMESGIFLNETRRLIWESAQQANIEWLRVWTEAWKSFPPAWLASLDLMSKTLVINVHFQPALQQGQLSLYTTEFIPIDDRQPRVVMYLPLFTAITWQCLVYWISLPARVQVLVSRHPGLTIETIDEVCATVTDELLPQIEFLTDTLPKWGQWLP